MSGFLIAVFVILWVVSAINAVRKAVAKAQAEAGGPDAVRAAIANAAAQSDSLARAAAGQRAVRVLRSRVSMTASSSSPLQTTYSSEFQKATAQPYLTPPADQAMSSLTSMEAPSMPTFDAVGPDPGLAAFSTGAQGVSSGAATGSAVLGGRGFLLPEGATAGAAAIVAAAIIGPPVGLRRGPQLASDW